MHLILYLEHGTAPDTTWSIALHLTLYLGHGRHLTLSLGNVGQLTLLETWRDT